MKALQHIVSGIDLTKFPSNVVPFASEGCIAEKQVSWQLFSIDEGSQANKVLELMHSNVCRPMKIVSMGRTKYFLTFIDDFSRKM